MSAGDVLVPLFFTALVTAIVFAVMIWSRRWNWMWGTPRAVRATQTSEEAWKDLLVGRIVADAFGMLTSILLAAAWLWDRNGRSEADAWLVWMVGVGAVLFFVVSLARVLMFARTLQRGWVKSQDTKLAREAHQLVERAIREEGAKARAEGEGC